MSQKSPQEKLLFRRLRVRQSVSGTAERPRLSVRRSQKHMYVQLVDDGAGRTLASASSLSPDLKEKGLTSGATVPAAKSVGLAIGEKARSLKIDRVVFDRGGRAYHGRVKAVADGAREAGLVF